MILQKRNPYVNQLQKERLVDYVTCNYDTLYGKQPYITESSKDELWNFIAVELNKIGAIKDVLGWKRCYASLKSSTIRKVKTITSEVPNELNSLQSKIIEASNFSESTGNSSVPQTKRSTLTNDQDANQIPKQSTGTGTYSKSQQRQQLVKLVGENYDALYGKLSNSSNGDIIKKKVWKIIAGCAALQV